VESRRSRSKLRPARFRRHMSHRAPSGHFVPWRRAASNASRSARLGCVRPLAACFVAGRDAKRLGMPDTRRTARRPRPAEDYFAVPAYGFREEVLGIIEESAMGSSYCAASV
jgi:hypothetical protein